MLRKARLGRQEGEWTKDQVIAGLLKFYEEHGRFPKVEECDSYAYLPSGRSIQRSFGGLLKLRQELGIAENYHQGAYRTDLSRMINERGRRSEEAIGEYLVGLFGEVAVHRESPVPGTKERLDFIVYHRDGKFGIDVFYPANLRNLQKIINIKEKKYRSFYDKLFFVSLNPAVVQEAIDGIISHKKNLLQKSNFVVTEVEFKKQLRFFKPLFFSMSQEGGR